MHNRFKCNLENLLGKAPKSASYPLPCQNDVVLFGLMLFLKQLLVFTYLVFYNFKTFWRAVFNLRVHLNKTASNFLNKYN